MTVGIFQMPGRYGQLEEIASVAAFMLSSDASFMTGHALVVDGGYTAGRDHGVTKLLGLAGPIRVKVERFQTTGTLSCDEYRRLTLQT